jgi:hypothetical protein
MANQYANTANLLLTAIFFHPLLPVSIPIAMVGMILNYWANKYVFLRRMRVPEQLSSLMPTFFANLIPYFAFIWSLDLMLFYRTLYNELFNVRNSTKAAPALGILIFAIIMILIPIRSCINKCYEGDRSYADETYDQKILQFHTDYDRENPVTKNEGLVRIMEKKLSMATSEEEKKQLQMQMNGVKNASIADAFSSYSMQKSVMYNQMQAMAAPRYMMVYQMPGMSGYAMGYQGYGANPYGGYGAMYGASYGGYGYGAAYG